MKKSLGLLWLAGCVSYDGVDPNEAVRAVRAWYQREESESEPLARVVITPVPGKSDLFLAIYDWQGEWWGSFGLFHLTDGVIDWEGGISGDGPDEQSIRRIRVVQVPGFDGPLVEVLGMTHMGNGSLYLYELRDGRNLHLLIQTRAVDSHSSDGETFRGGHLEASYTDENGDGRVDLVLSGEIEEWDESCEVVLGTLPYRRVFFWDSSRGQFR